MDLKTANSALIMMRRIFDNRITTLPKLKTSPQKPPFGGVVFISQPFERASPESEGIESGRVAAFLRELEMDKTLDMHGIILLRNGKIISEATFGAYRQDIWHVTHSGCKTIIALAIGMLADDGELDISTPVVGLFPEKAGPVARFAHRSMTVEHLLSMRSGVVFNEAGAITQDDWVRCFFESAEVSEPGKTFAYNSMNSYMLAAIVKQVTGLSVCEYLAPRLFGPLGITRYFWEKCPMGIEKGGWGLYILPEDMAKIGQLVMDGGLWRGERLVSAEWIEKMTRPQAEPPDGFGGFDYGLQIWLGRERDSFLFNGMFCQNVMGYRDSGIMLLTNAGNGGAFQQSSFFATADRYFGGDYFPPAGGIDQNPAELAELRRVESRLGRDWLAAPVRPKRRFLSRLFARRRFKEGYPPEPCRAFLGKTFYAEKEAACAVGLMPLCTQIMQNSYTGGLLSFSFRMEGGGVMFEFVECGESYRLPIGFGAPEYCDLVVRGEPHRAGISARAAFDEDGDPVLIIRVSFLEISSARIMRLYLKEGAVLARFYERPGREDLVSALGLFRGEPGRNALIDALFGRLDIDYIKYKIKATLEPEFILKEKE